MPGLPPSDLGVPLLNLHTLLPLLALSATACLSWEESTLDGLRVRTVATTVPATQGLGVSVEVLPGETALAFTGVLPTDSYGYIARVVDPSGQVVYEAEDWWEAPRNKTNAGFSASVLHVNWPVSEADGPLTPGVWTLDARSQHVGEAFDGTMMVKSDDDFTRGTLQAEIVFAGSLGDDAELVRGVEAAAAIWRDEVYADAGITLQVTTRRWDGPSVLASPGFGDPEAYQDASADKPVRGVSVLIIERVSDGVNILGVAGGIPGPLVPTDRSVVAINALEAGGRDGAFSAAEERLLAETIAHEVGHYLGLFHPAELPDALDRITTWDVLDDTPECTAFDGCARVLGTNLMFPTPLCAEGNGLTCAAWVEQATVSGEQAGVMHRYVGVQ